MFFSTDYFEADVERSTCLRRHQGVIYHKFSHGAVSYTLNGENVNVVRILFKDKYIVDNAY